MNRNQLRPGRLIAGPQIWDVPVGSTISQRNRELTGYRDPVCFLLSNRYCTGTDQVHDYGEWTLDALPDEPFVDNLSKFQQRVRTIVRGRSQMHLGETGQAMSVVDGLNIPNFDPTIGMWVDLGDRDLARQLPSDAIVAVGNPNKWDQYALYQRYDRSDWRVIAGGFSARMSIGGVLVEATGLGQDEWVNAEPEEGEAEAIRALQRRLWDVGQIARADYSWCSTADYVMGLLGARRDLPETTEAAA